MKIDIRHSLRRLGSLAMAVAAPSVAPALALTLALALATACSQNDSDIDDAEPPTLEFWPLNKNLDFEDGQKPYTMRVTSNKVWTFESDSEWIHGEKDVEKSRLTITLDGNDEPSSRSGKIVVRAESLTDTLFIRQLGWGKEILLSEQPVILDAAGGEFAITVTANFKVKAIPNADWVSEAAPTRAHPAESNTRIFVARSNATDKTRSTTITFCEDTETESEFKPKTFTVYQNPDNSGYSQGNADDLDTALQPVKIMGGEASVYFNNDPAQYPFANSFDGKGGTFYASGHGEAKFPVELIYYLDNESIEYLIYRPGGAPGVYFGVVDIYVLSDANTRAEEEWTFVMTHDFKERYSAASVKFPTPLIGVKAVKFVAHKTSEIMIGVGEMEFYRRNPDDIFDWASLFTDRSCSELRAGVTTDDIEKCEYAFYRSIAFYLYHNRYPKEFRIKTCNCYPHPDMQAAVNKTTPYSLLDNPTGMAVENGEEIVVLADLHGHDLDVKLRVLDFSKGAGPESPVDYSLISGVNKLKMTQKGLCYIMYHYSDPDASKYMNYRDEPPVQIHFAAGGTVNGYYDKCDPNLKNRGNQLLGNASHRYFDVVGEHTHLIYPTQDMRDMTGGNNLGKLSDAYDDLVYREMELLGLVKYGGMFQNRLCFSVVNHQSFMYSTNYYTGYQAGTMGTMCSVAGFLSDAWGPSHEVGHTMQTRPGLKWAGMSECTNNIMALYIQTHIRELPSRMQSGNSYTPAWNALITAQQPHNAGNLTNRLIPFWQLQLYFGDVLEQTPQLQDDHGGFYPDVYEYLRKNPNLTHGQSQANFAYVASLCAKADLTDFFEKWGFLREIDLYVSDANASGQLTVTKEYADDVRRRIADLPYDKPAVALEYITDNSVAIFRDGLTVTQGGTAVCTPAAPAQTRTAPAQTRSEVEDEPQPDTSDNMFTMSIGGWQNVVAYEVRTVGENGGDGELVYAADGSMPTPEECLFTFPLPNGDKWSDGYELYAVQYDNRRIPVAVAAE